MAKKLNYEVLPQDHPAYNILHEAVSKWHDDLRQAKIALAWRKNQKPDADGRLVLGECHLVTDLQKEFIDFDFIILLNQEVWNNPQWGDRKKYALIDHELCHAAQKLDAEEEQEVDERGRPVWRQRKRDLEEFREVVQRHGTYKVDLELFAEALLAKAKEEAQS